MRAIVIPADPAEPCSEIVTGDPGWHDTLRHLVGGLPEPARYDRDAVLWLSDDSAASQPVNSRATAYAFGHSEMAARNGTDPARPPYQLHGTIIVTGAVLGGQPPSDAPARFRLLLGISPG